MAGASRGFFRLLNGVCSGSWTEIHRDVLDEVLHVIGTLGLSIQDLKGITEVQLALLTRASDRRDTWMSETIGRHLGSLLDVDTLHAMFYQSDAPPDGVRSGEPPPQRAHTHLYTPLALLLRPELSDGMRTRAAELMPQGSREAPEDPDAVHVDSADIEHLRALARRAEKRIDVALGEARKGTISDAMAHRLGIDEIVRE